jgi:hypothetical protein
MKNRRAARCAACLLACLPVLAAAQVPALISNQGRLFDGEKMLNGEVDLVLRVYTNATAGTWL